MAETNSTEGNPRSRRHPSGRVRFSTTLILSSMIRSSDRALVVRPLMVLWMLDILATAFVIHFIHYTEIDWTTYMQQASVFLEGARDYKLLTGSTGPCVYPAGHVYFYALMHYLTRGGTAIRVAQYLFLVIYAIHQALVLRLYWCVAPRHFPNWSFLFLFLSYRGHSIFVLRLFNDPVAMTLFYASCLFLVHKKVFWSVIFYSLALSVKMNILLFLPGYVLLITRQEASLFRMLFYVLVLVMVQVAIAWPFISVSRIFALHYFQQAFDFSRAFLFQWTVNWRFLGENIFTSRLFSRLLLFLHLTTLLVFAQSQWMRAEGGLVSFVRRYLSFRTKGPRIPVSQHEIVVILFTCNLIGIVFARSLHYQFYIWYAPQIPFLLSHSYLSAYSRVGLWFLIEYCYTVYPSTKISSLLLLGAHLFLLLNLLIGAAPLEGDAAMAAKRQALMAWRRQPEVRAAIREARRLRQAMERDQDEAEVEIEERPVPLIEPLS